MGYIIAGLFFYLFGWGAGYIAGRGRVMEIPIYLMYKDGYKHIDTKKIDWDEELKKLRDKESD